MSQTPYCKYASEEAPYWNSHIFVLIYTKIYRCHSPHFRQNQIPQIGRLKELFYHADQFSLCNRNTCLRKLHWSSQCHANLVKPHLAFSTGKLMLSCMNYEILIEDFFFVSVCFYCVFFRHKKSFYFHFTITYIFQKVFEVSTRVDCMHSNE